MKKFVLALLASLGACSTTGVEYQYFYIHPEVTPPMLYAPDPKDDLNLLITCSPDPACSAPNPPATARCGKCVGMLVDEYFKMKQELLELRQALKDCQNGPPPK